ncbi:leukocyte immunoglobulin-like receptor subfamily A member 2 isoform X2 [Artibeus jamaicensis]|uniref:leukocyte immunoglobulin-like receptor subfamily A member 2 isoform X2 n=1 Tax=Artibeus jamaicensis TaxID=9417 RepID=UPI00235B1D88|nr:leukocyte immunoglobulin-like receptor subfamily A member 2 isoform X2 [Artibeus jamaicensis]
MRNPGPVTQKSDHVTRHLLLCVAVNLDVVCTLVTMAGSTMTWTLSVLLCLGLCWGPWDQVQAEFGPKLSIWADPGPIVSKGNPVTIWCQGSLQVDGYILFKEKSSEPLNTTITQASSHKTGFLIQSMSSYDTGLYQCAYSTGGRLSERSEPLLLVLTGMYREPSLSAQPSFLVLPGDSLTLQCGSEPGSDRFALTKDEGPTPHQHLHGQHSPDFHLGPVNLTHGGQYRCYSGHNLSYVWSAPSAPLDILITALLSPGMYRKPSLSVQPGPLVAWGLTVTLQCRSEVRADTFHLHREGSLDPPQQLHLQNTAAPSQANFTISPVTWGHQGIYRCYSSHSSSPFQLSQPSDPLELLVSDYTVGNLIRLGVSGFILVVLGVLLCEAWHSWRRPHDAARS